MRRLLCVMLIVWLSACNAATPAPAATPPASPFDQFAEERERMVDDQIIPQDVTDPIVLQAMRRVPRHEFVPPEYLGQSYEDHPLPSAMQPSRSCSSGKMRIARESAIGKEIAPLAISGDPGTCMRYSSNCS
jgi:hypothetical protein